MILTEWFIRAECPWAWHIIGIETALNGCVSQNADPDVTVPSGGGGSGDGGALDAISAAALAVIQGERMSHRAAQ